MRDQDTILAADFRGLSVKEMADFRGRLREAEAQFSVVKNTLARRAATDAEREQLLPLLTGPCGLVWASGDAAAAAKALKEFSDEHDGRPAITGGLLEGEEIDVPGITKLAKLPSRDQLMANMASGLVAPISGLAGGLDSLLSGLARTLASVAAQREGEEAA